MKRLIVILVIVLLGLILLGKLKSSKQNVQKDLEPLRVSSDAKVQLLGDMTIRDWSPDGKRLLGDKKDSSGTSQIYTWATDGSDEQSIEGLAKKCHKGFAHYHPSGRYIVATVEMDFGCPKKSSDPGAAANTNLWVYDFKTNEWTNLTGYPYPKSVDDLAGALSPYFSHDGKKLIWSRISKPANFLDKHQIFGIWQPYIADFLTDGKPRLENITKLDLGNGSLFEMHGFSKDNKSIIFSSDIDLEYTAGLDLFKYDLQTKQLTNLTKTPDFYDEHARFSPDGTKIVWGSSSCCEKYDKKRFLGTLQSEAFVMDTDGSNISQITQLNSLGKRTGNWPTAFSPDGKSFISAQQFYDNTPGKSYLITLP